MYMHPYLASQVAKERQREMLAHAEKRRLVAQASAAAKGGRQPAKSPRPTRHAILRVLRLRLEPQR
jgi:hypothetical protein